VLVLCIVLFIQITLSTRNYNLINLSLNTNLLLVYVQQESHWKRNMLLNWIWSIGGRTCKLTPRVHQNMTKKTIFFYEFFLGEILVKDKGEIKVKCKI